MMGPDLFWADRVWVSGRAAVRKEAVALLCAFSLEGVQEKMNAEEEVVGLLVWEDLAASGV
jgi:hypothetical protein